MTYSDDFVPVEDNQDLEGPSYPTAFGIELTPTVQGIGIAVLGVALAGYLFYQFVSKTQERRNETKARVDENKELLENQQEQTRRVEAVRQELDAALTQREGIYSLLGAPSSLDTLVIDINQQIEASNASIAQAIARDFDTFNATQLASAGLTNAQIDRIRTQFVENPVLQRIFYTSELLQFTPNSATSGVVEDEVYGPELAGQLERQTAIVSFRSLFPQAQSIIRNLERLEPLVIITGFEQRWAEIETDLEPEDLIGLTRPLITQFNLEVLVPIGDPREPPDVTEPEVETVEGVEGEAEIVE